MLSLIEPPPTVQSDSDDDKPLNRYVVVAENMDRGFVIISYVNARDEQSCRNLTMRWFLKTDHGVPTKCTIVPVSDEVEYINITSNDEDVCEYLGIDMPEERKGK